jgi:hypothetical protein
MAPKHLNIILTDTEEELKIVEPSDPEATPALGDRRPETAAIP